MARRDLGNRASPVDRAHMKRPLNNFNVLINFALNESALKSRELFSIRSFLVFLATASRVQFSCFAEGNYYFDHIYFYNERSKVHSFAW